MKSIWSVHGAYFHRIAHIYALDDNVVFSTIGTDNITIGEEIGFGLCVAFHQETVKSIIIPALISVENGLPLFSRPIRGVNALGAYTCVLDGSYALGSTPLLIDLIEDKRSGAYISFIRTDIPIILEVLLSWQSSTLK